MKFKIKKEVKNKNQIKGRLFVWTLLILLFSSPFSSFALSPKKSRLELQQNSQVQSSQPAQPIPPLRQVQPVPMAPSKPQLQATSKTLKAAKTCKALLPSSLRRLFVLKIPTAQKQLQTKKGIGGHL